MTPSRDGQFMPPRDTPQPTEVLKTKLLPARVPPHAIARQRCLARLSEGAHCRLTLLSAGAGFGKSTLLAQWVESESKTRPVAWLRLDERENDPVVLWSYVIAAVQRVTRADFGASALSALASSAPVEELALTRLVNELIDEDVPLCIVLDDLHRVSSSLAIASLAWFIDHAPSNVRLIAASRSDPVALPLSRLRAQGELVELRADELRFDNEEAAAFLNVGGALGLTDEAVRALESRTEGWPVGLQLASISLTSAPDRERFARDFDAANENTLDYLVREVLNTLPPPLQEFVLRISTVERVSASLCDVMLTREGSQKDLQELAGRNLFIEAASPLGHWYQFHHLLRTALQIELRLQHPGLDEELLRRAAIWHHEQGNLSDAMSCAFEAHDYSLARDFLFGDWLAQATKGHLETVTAWLGQFPPSVISTDGGLQGMLAWTLALDGKPSEALSILRSIEESTVSMEAVVPSTWFASVASSVAALKAFLPSGDARLDLASAREAVTLEPAGSAWRVFPCWILGRALRNAGHDREGTDWFREAVATGPAAGHWALTASSYAYLAIIARDAGELDDFHRFAETGASIAMERETGGIAGLPDIVHGASLAAQGRTEDAEAMVRGGSDTIARRGHPFERLNVISELVALAQVHGGTDDIPELLREADAILAACVDPGIWTDRIDRLRRTVQPQAGSTPLNQASSAALTDRELTVLRLLSSNLSERELATELFVSFNTLHSHTRSIYRKLGASSRKEAIHLARVRALLDPKPTASR